MVQPVCPLYTLPHSQRMQYMPETLRQKSSFTNLSRCEFIWLGHTPFICWLCLLLKMLHVEIGH
jgi:hypothetical protein